MVSKANEDLPEPLRPVITVRLLRGICTSMFLRLWTRAPHTYCVVVHMSLLLCRKGLCCSFVAREEEGLVYCSVASWRAKDKALSIVL